MLESHLQKIVCCIGQPVAGNPTQYVMEKALEAADLDWRFLTFEVPPDDLAAAVAGMRAMRFHGGSFLAPHQAEMVRQVDRLGRSAELLGAVSLIRTDEDQLVGENTEGLGVVKALAQFTQLDSKKVTLVGSGAATKAVTVELGLCGVPAMRIVGPDDEAMSAWVESLNGQLVPEIVVDPWQPGVQIDEETEVVVDCLGLEESIPDSPSIDVGTLTESTIVVESSIDQVDDDHWIQQAASRGCRVVDGLGLLVQKIAVDFKIWTGIDADLEVVREAFEEYYEL